MYSASSANQALCSGWGFIWGKDNPFLEGVHCSVGFLEINQIATQMANSGKEFKED